MRKAQSLFVGSVEIGGNAPVSVQSMTNTDTRDAESTLSQITQLQNAGCEIVRLAVPDNAAIKPLTKICSQSPLPVIADIHFDHRLAIASLESGVHGLRLNPGNIGGKKQVDLVVDAAKSHNSNIRIGVNSGSIHKKILEQFGGPTPEAMVASALEHIQLLEQRNFFSIKVSLKSSSVPATISAYRLMARSCNYPFHIGITESGTLLHGAVKSSVGIGILLSEGLGNTLRVSLTHDPVKEVEVAWQILRSLELRKRGPQVISCPTCGRTEIDLITLAEATEERLKNIKETFTVAVMGCVVNGPGEAKEADVGIAGGRGKGILFRKGSITGSVIGNQKDLLDALMREIETFLKERSQ